MYINLKQQVLALNHSIILEGAGILIVFGYFFYRSILWTIILSPIIIFYYRKRNKELKEKEKWILMLQFKELLISVNGSVQAGSSMENAFLAAFDDMLALFGKEAAIVKELITIRKGLNNNSQITELLHNFSKRSGVDEIRNFANIMRAGKNSGGNLKSIMESYIRMIDEKVAVMQETENLMIAAKYEQRIMNIIPFLIILYVDITSKGFFDLLYHNILGNIVMTLCLIIYIGAVLLSEKIYNIRL